MNTKKIIELQEQINQIKQHLFELGEMRPGSLSVQYNVCGNPACKCKHPQNPEKHGPYNQLSYTFKGKSRTEFVKQDMVAQTKRQLENYKTFKRLTAQWVELSVELAKLRKKENEGEKK